MVPVSKDELETAVVSLKQKTNDLIERIERLRHQTSSRGKAVGRN